MDPLTRLRDFVTDFKDLLENFGDPLKNFEDPLENSEDPLASFIDLFKDFKDPLHVSAVNISMNIAIELILFVEYITSVRYNCDDVLYMYNGNRALD